MNVYGLGFEGAWVANKIFLRRYILVPMSSPISSIADRF